MKSENDNPYRCTGCWYLYVFYFNRKDPRLIVPKRFGKLGWTMNFARPMALPVLLVIIAAVLAPFTVLEYFEIQSGWAYVAAFLMILIGLITFCTRMSNPARYQNRDKT